MKDGATTTTPNDPIVHWANVHPRQRPSYRWTKGRSCTNSEFGPLKWSCSHLSFLEKEMYYGVLEIADHTNEFSSDLLKTPSKCYIFPTRPITVWCVAYSKKALSTGRTIGNEMHMFIQDSLILLRTNPRITNTANAPNISPIRNLRIILV